MVFKNFFKFFVQNGKNAEDLSPLTDFLKKSNHFQKVAWKIHYTKEGVKNKVLDSFDGLLKNEDELKLIEDDHNKSKNNQQKDNNNKK